ncbi:MAG: hypothetical protein ACP5QO_09230 [Clostridia bacterium]|jgi:hypothetical protein
MDSPQNRPGGAGTLAGFLVLGWRLSRSRRGYKRRVRRVLYGRLCHRWLHYNGAAVPGSEEPVVRAIWLGSTMRSRSLVAGYRRGRRVPLVVRILARLLGDRAAALVLGALVAWRWAKGEPPGLARAY